MLHNNGTNKAGKLRIAVITTAKYFVPRLLGPFCDLYPGIDISLKVTNRERLLQRIADNEDDWYILGPATRAHGYMGRTIS